MHLRLKQVIAGGTLVVGLLDPEHRWDRAGRAAPTWNEHRADVLATPVASTDAWMPAGPRSPDPIDVRPPPPLLRSAPHADASAAPTARPTEHRRMRIGRRSARQLRAASEPVVDRLGD